MRNKIYSMTFGGNSIHVTGTRANATNSFELIFDKCDAPHSEHEPFTSLVGAAHSPSSLSTTYDPKWEPCDSDRVTFYTKRQCRQPVQLSSQLLRVNSQIHDEAAAFLYSENCWIFVNPTFKLSDEFCKQFSRVQREAIQTVALFLATSAYVYVLLSTLPDLKRLWLDFSVVNDLFYTHLFDVQRWAEDSSSNLFLSLKRLDLVGVAVKAGADVSLKETVGLERLLLGLDVPGSATKVEES